MRKMPKHEPTEIYLYLSIQLDKCIVISDTFSLHFDPVRMEMTGTQYIPISQVFSSDESKSKGIIADEDLLQVCSKDECESESVIVDKSSTQESESKSVHKSINANKVKDSIY